MFTTAEGQMSLYCNEQNCSRLEKEDFYDRDLEPEIESIFNEIKSRKGELEPEEKKLKENILRLLKKTVLESFFWEDFSLPDRIEQL